MSRPKKTNGRKTGGSRMIEKGYKASQLWYTPEQYDLVKLAAAENRRPMSRFAILATLAAAHQVVKQHNGHPGARGPKGVNRG